MPRTVKRYPNETIATVLAALLMGESVSDVARKYKIDKSLVSRWKAKFPKEKFHQIATDRADDFNRLITEFLREGITTLSVQLRHVRQESFLKKQGATELAALFGTTSDRVFRVLEAITVAEDSGDRAAGGNIASPSEMATFTGSTDDGI